MEMNCRLCLGPTSTKLTLSLANEEIRLMVDSVFNFKIKSVAYLPQTICLQCSSTVTEFYQYSKKVQTIQQRLEEEHSVEFETVIVENIKIGPECEADHQVNVQIDTIDESEMFHDDLDGKISSGDARSNNGNNSQEIQEFKVEAHDESSMEPSGNQKDFEQADSTKLEDRILRCNLCDRLFSNSLHFKTHQREHQKKECPVCGKQVHAKHLPKHIADSHQTKPATDKKRHENVQLPASQYKRDRMIDLFIGIRCELCQFGIYKTFADLLVHYRTKHGVQGYVRCCGDKLVTQSAAAEHALVHQGAFACKYCDKTFISKHSVKRHCAAQHPIDDDNSESRVLLCRLCNITFTSEEQFIRHRNNHGNNEDCRICGKTVRKSYLKKHINAVHADPSKKRKLFSSTELRKKQAIKYDQIILENLGLRCELCHPEETHNFKQFDSLCTHYRTEHSMRGYVRCCGKQFFIRSNAVLHIVAHKRSYRCHLCDKTLSSRTSLVNHMGIIHASDNPEDCPYKCNECDASFSNKPQLRMHQKRHKRSACSFCGKTFLTLSLQEHIASKHAIGQRDKQICHICGKFAPNKTALLSHMKHMHEEPNADQNLNAKIECVLCKTMIKGNTSMKWHMKAMHSDASNQECKICGKFIRSSFQMKKHMKDHQSNGPERHQCPFCLKWFKGKRYVRKHIQCLHEEKGKSFQCDLCEHESPNSQALAAHKVRMHRETSDQLKCEHCGKILKSTKSLRDHIAIHTGEKLYTCEFCGKKFTSNANYYSHRKKNHLKEMQAEKGTKFASENSTPTKQNG